MCVLLIIRLLRSVRMLGARKPVNHTSGVTACYSYWPSKSVRNCCIIEIFGGVFYVVTMLFGFFCGCMGVCHRTESDLFLFSLSKAGYWLGVCHGWVHLHGLLEMQGTQLQSKRKYKWKYLAHNGIRTRYLPLLRSRLAINCATRSDIHNRLKCNRVFPVLFTCTTWQTSV